MNPFVVLLPCPVLIALAAAFSVPVRVLTRAAAALMTLELLLSVHFFGAVAAGRTAALVRGPFRFDQVSGVFLILTTLVVTAACIHAVPFFAAEASSGHAPRRQHITQVYLFLPAFFLAMLTVVCADNIGLLWIGIEATTLLSAPLVYFHRTRTALEATWKYLIVCGVGIAFAFLGTAVLFAAAQHVAALPDGSLSLAVLMAHATSLPGGMMRLGFVLALLGYGTKAGLFPLHSWLPDAHSEAPAPISAVLSGALLNCALVAIWRLSGLAAAAGQAELVRATIVPMGAITVLAAAIFLLKQRDIKRLLAYSSMENVGMLAVAIGLGFGPGFVLQALNHSLAKVALFLIAGNVLQQYGTKSLRDVRGMLAGSPAQAVLFILLLAAAAGAPPFGAFLAEWRILAHAADAGRSMTVATLVIALAVAFIAVCIHGAGVLFGSDSSESGARAHRPVLWTPALLLACTLALGVALSPSLPIVGWVAR